VGQGTEKNGDTIMRLVRTCLGVLSALVALIGLASVVSAQTAKWPNGTVTIVVAFPAGGPTDVLARAIADDLEKRFHGQFVVENRSGAAGNVGAAAVAKAKPDGSTFLFATTSVVNNRFMYKHLPFDTDRDLTPVVLVGKTPVILVASKKSGLKTLADLIAAAKAHPGKLNYGSPGLGTAAQIAVELLSSEAGIKLTQIPYRGSTPMIADLLGNQIDLVTDLMPTQIPQVKAGNYTGLVMTGAKRSAALPNVPTVAESGFPGFEAVSWNAILAPTGTPKDIIDKMNAAVNDYLNSDRGRADLAKFDMQLGGGTPQDLKAFMASEVVKWGPIIKAAHISRD
jgi:tripartite-type tricarboxylate transporter receptor subunit TctC